MKGGHNRKPAGLKLLDGNPGDKPIPAEPPAPTGEPEKPRGLRGRAAQLWDEKSVICIELGSLTRGAEHQFAVWCKLAAKSETRFAKMSVAELTEMRRLADAFGLSAQGRARLGVVPKKPKGNPFKALA